jgi:cell division protein FtsA
MALPPIVALEIGTSKVVALVGEMREDSYIMITGVGECPSKGMRKGEVTDVEAVTGCVRTAMEAAEENGKVVIRQVLLAISGGHILSVSNRGSVPVMNREGAIDADDVEQVRNVARAVNLSGDRDIIHSLSQHYCIDDQERIIRPDGMAGARLTHDMLIIHALRSRMETAMRIVQGLPMDVEDVVFSGLCSALAVMTPEQRKSGCLVIDMGAGTTDYMAYAGSVPAAAGVIGVGSDHITNDIAMAFNISATHAERLKRETASALAGGVGRSQRATLPPETGFPSRSVSLSSLHAVVHARAEETLSIVRARLEKDDVLKHLSAVVLTGGGARMRGLTELAEQIFEKPCDVGRPRGVTGASAVTDGPEYATCSGLVQYGFKEHSDRRREPWFDSWMKGLGRLLRPKS